MTLPLAIRRRRWALVALVVAVTAYAIIARFNVRVVNTANSGTSYEAGFEAASFIIGFDTPQQGSVYAPDWFVRTSDYTWLRADAWRPYHQALAPLPKRSPYHYLVVPLWYIPAAAFGYLFFTHGVIRGMRRSVLNACTRCGYDLGSLPGARAERVCPECGQRQGGALSRRGVEPTSAAVVEVKLPAAPDGAAHDPVAPHSGHVAAASSPSRE